MEGDCGHTPESSQTKAFNGRYILTTRSPNVQQWPTRSGAGCTTVTRLASVQAPVGAGSERENCDWTVAGFKNIHTGRYRTACWPVAYIYILINISQKRTESGADRYLRRQFARASWSLCRGMHISHYACVSFYTTLRTHAQSELYYYTTILLYNLYYEITI